MFLGHPRPGFRKKQLLGARLTDGETEAQEDLLASFRDPSEGEAGPLQTYWESFWDPLPQWALLSKATVRIRLSPGLSGPSVSLARPS